MLLDSIKNQKVTLPFSSRNLLFNQVVVFHPNLTAYADSEVCYRLQMGEKKAKYIKMEI